MPNGGVREVEDFMLSRYACYLIVMNGDPRKEVIAVGQTYFAIKTRQQELVENYDELTENQKRIAIRHEMAEHNKSGLCHVPELWVHGPVWRFEGCGHQGSERLEKEPEHS